MIHKLNGKQLLKLRAIAASGLFVLLVLTATTMAYARQQTAQKVDFTNTPILFTGNGGSLDGERRPIWAIFTKAARISDWQISGQDGITAPKWSRQRNAVIATRDSGQIVFCPYDSAKKRFGQPQSLISAFANQGMSYKIPQYAEFDWSSDDSNLVYADRKGLGLMLLNLKTGKKRVVASRKSHPANFDFVALSPDGKRVAFSTPTNDGSLVLDPGQQPYEHLWVVNIDGSKPRKLGIGMKPSWSADGRYLIAIRGEYNGGNKLYRYEVASGKRRTLITRSLSELTTAVYSPDGKRIAVAGTYDKGNYHTGIFLLNEEGKLVKVVATSKQLTANGTSFLNPIDMDW